jgi:hypothetical protein
MIANRPPSPRRRVTVTRLAALAIGMVLLSCPNHLLAQHGGHGGGGRRGTPGASGDTSDASLTDFNHALAVQATSDQASHFPDMTKSTESARKLAQELAELKGERSTDFSGKSAALKEAVEEVQSGNQDFLKSFTKSQKAGLKELTKKLEKADSDVARQWKELERQFAGAKSNGEGVAGAADKLEKALEEFQSQQIGLGKEMGIQTPAT